MLILRENSLKSDKDAITSLAVGKGNIHLAHTRKITGERVAYKKRQECMCYDCKNLCHKLKT